MSLSYDAMVFVQEEFKDIKRNYTGEDYFSHLAEVAGIASTVRLYYPDQEVFLAISWLHDFVDDCLEEGDTTGELAKRKLSGKFGGDVASGVYLLSDICDGLPKTISRKERLSKSCTRLASIPGSLQSIKAADIFSNAKSIVRFNPSFAKIYLPEKIEQLKALTYAPRSLVDLAMSKCQHELGGLK